MIKLKRQLKCSFCGKRESEVDKLLGGHAGGHICDGCVAACNRILEATPPGFKGWDTLTDTQLLASLPSAQATAEAVRAVLQTQVETLRQRGVSWAAIGEALGISRQAAWERFS